MRERLRIGDIMLIDSPGMIDSPATLPGVRAAPPSPSTEPGVLRAADATTQERGYDFLGVSKWLAEQADVILLFFDPDKPGTTGWG